MRVLHVMVQRFCPVQNAGLCTHREFDDYQPCPLLGFYHALVSEGGEVLRPIKELGDFTLQGAYFGAWLIIGYVGIRQSAVQADVMRSFFNDLAGEHEYGPGLHALGYGVSYEEQLATLQREGKIPPSDDKTA